MAIATASARNTKGKGHRMVGTVCFKWDNWPDTWHWSVRHQDSITYQIVGYDEHFTPTSSMVGDGVKTDGHFYGTVTHTHGQFHTLIRVDVDLATMKGTATYSWLDVDNSVLSTFIDAPFSRVPCSVKK